MKIAVFSSHRFEEPFLTQANLDNRHQLTFFEERLSDATVSLAKGFPAIACFSTDDLSKTVLSQLAQANIQLIALRSAGFNHVDVEAAKELKLRVVRVPAYSPYAIAEFAVGLILNLNRKIHRAHNRVRTQNFDLEGLLGFDLHGRTVGIIGTGHIGAVFAKVMNGFGCRLLAADPIPNRDCEQLGVSYVSLAELYKQSDIISLHCPLTQATRYLINEAAVNQMKPGVMLINTSRGALLNTDAVIEGIKTSKIGYLGLDVYEGEGPLFFRNLEDTIIQDSNFMCLQAFPNVLITAHQGFYTHQAIEGIESQTLQNVTAFEQGTLSDTVIVA